MKLSLVTLSAILLSTAAAAPVAEAMPQAVSVPDANPFLLSWIANTVAGVVGAATNIAIGIFGGSANNFNCNAFGLRFVKLSQRYRTGTPSLVHFAIAKAKVIELALTVPFYGIPRITCYEDIANHLASIGQRYQNAKVVGGLRWAVVSAILSKLEWIAPPKIYHNNLHGCGQQFITWGNKCKSNPSHFGADKLQILLESCAQLNIICKGSPYNWDSKKKYDALFFGDRLVEYGNRLNNGDVGNDYLESINGSIDNLTPIF